MSRKWIDVLVTGLAAFLVLLGMAFKYNAFVNSPDLRTHLAAGGAMLFYALQFGLFVFRHPSKDALTNPKHFFFAVGGTFLPLALRLSPTNIPLLTLISWPVELLGIGLTIIAISTLGRGFGIIAANREIKTQGLYRFIRHPLYTAEAVWFLSFILQNFTVYNVVLLAVQMGFQFKRMRDEESLLGQDPVYAQYMSQVRFRMLPGVF